MASLTHRPSAKWLGGLLTAGWIQPHMRNRRRLPQRQVNTFTRTDDRLYDSGLGAAREAVIITFFVPSLLVMGQHNIGHYLGVHQPHSCDALMIDNLSAAHIQRLRATVAEARMLLCNVAQLTDEFGVGARARSVARLSA